MTIYFVTQTVLPRVHCRYYAPLPQLPFLYVKQKNMQGELASHR